MNLLIKQRPWVLLIIGLALVYAEDEEDEALADNNTTNTKIVPSRRPFTISNHENLLRKITSTVSTPTSETTDDNFALKSAISSKDGEQNVGITVREGRIMVTSLRPNRSSSDTTDFVRNTVPIKEQTQTEPTVKKTEPPSWKPSVKKPSLDLKNKIKVGERSRYGGGPPGPDASMLAYNAFTPQLSEPTTERHNRKPFTTRSRPPPLGYLNQSSLPPTAWALTTLKGSAPAAAESARNTIPATASDNQQQTKPSKSRTTLSSLKPFSTFWSTRLSSRIPSSTAPAMEVSESTEPSINEEKTTSTSKTSPLISEIVSKPDEIQQNKIIDKKTSTPELSAIDANNNSILTNKEEKVTKTELNKDTQINKILLKDEKTNENNETQIKTDKEEVTTQKTTSNEIESHKEKEIIVIKNNSNKTINVEPIEALNEAIKTPDEDNKLSKIIIDKNYVIKPETYEHNELLNSGKFENNHTTENYQTVLTEKPSVVEVIKEKSNENNNKTDNVGDKPTVKFVENTGDFEREFHTGPYVNIINETELNVKSLPDVDKIKILSLNSTPTIIVNQVNIDNQTNFIKETDQSTTSMTRATNATQSPVNATTEATVVTSASIINETSSASAITQDEVFSTTVSVKTEISEFLTQPTSTPSPNVSNHENVTALINSTSIDRNDNIDEKVNSILSINKTNEDNDIKTISELDKSKNLTKLNELITEQPVIINTNNSIHTLAGNNNYELNQTNNDIKLGGELDVVVPTVMSIPASSTIKSNFIRTTTEKVLTTAIVTDLETGLNTQQPATVSNLVKDRFTTVSQLSMKNDTEITTLPSSVIIHETDDLNDEDGMIYNTTGNDNKFAIDSVLNITDHEFDEGVDDLSGEKDIGDTILNTTQISDETTASSNTGTTEEVSVTTVISVTSSSSVKTTVIVTTPNLEEDGVTPVEDDSTGMEIEDYDTGVIMPMMVRMFVHATYKEMCLAEDLLIDSIVRFFQTVADRNIDREQIKIKNLKDCASSHPENKGVGVPVNLMLTDSHGQYDKRLTDIFVLLVRQESFAFKYPITQVDKIIDHEMSMDAETQGRGTIIAAIVISSIAGLCLLVLTILLVIMRKRQRGFNYGQRCTPVSLDDYSLDNISVYNSVRRKAMRASKRSYGNPAFDDPTAITSSLNFAGLANAVIDKAKLEEEYSRVPVVTVKSDELPMGAEVKNRYANVIPLPETRVTLNTPNNNDVDQFINANFVKGVKSTEKFYIACQAPMRDTITDFWQMVWEQQSRIIIMLTDLHENGVEKCADYLPPSEVLDCHRVFGDLQVTLKKREVREKYVISSLQLKNLDSNLWREVTHLWYVGWPARGVPDDLSSIIAFLIEARSYAKNGPPPPVVVHCSPGTGRTGTIIAIDIAIRDFETNRIVDIPKTVYNIRRDRAGAVQTSQQYSFIYQVIHLYATKLTGGGLDSI